MCPECGEPLVGFELEGVEIDHCISCGGTWLDAGELETISELAGVESGGLSKALASAKAIRADPRRCPRCDKKMQVFTIGSERLVELDRCSHGHGLWFDRGEMKSVISAFEEGQEGEVARFFAKLYRSELEEEAEGA